MSDLKEYNFNKLYTMSSGISSKPEQAGYGSPFVSFSTVFKNYFLPEILIDYMNTSEQEQEIYSIKKGDVFLTRTSETIDELGMSCVALKDYPKATFSGFVKRLRPNQTNITYDKYIGFYLRSKFFRKTMTNNAIMTLRASLNEDIFSYLKLYLPDYKTQKNSGDLLYLLNSKIELNNRINAELEAMAKTLYDYWFVQFDFPFDFASTPLSTGAQGKPDKNGKPYKSSGGKMVWNEELKREIPEGWEAGKIGDYSEVNSGFAFNSSWWKKEGVPVIKITNIQEDYTINLNACSYVSDDKAEIAKDYTANPFDVVIAMTGATIGKYAIIPDIKKKILINQRVGLFNLGNDPLLKLPFLINSLKLSYFRNSIFLISSGCAQPNISADQINSIKIIFPPADLIYLYNNTLRSNFIKIINNQKENLYLSKLRDWLLPMLMNGQAKAV